MIGVCILGCAWSARAATPIPVDRWIAEGLALSDSYIQEMNLERLICREEIESGVNRGEFTAEHLESFNAWLLTLDSSRSSPGQSDRRAGVLWRPALPDPAVEPMIWLDARRARLINARARLRLQLSQVAILRAEETWLAADRTADLREAIAEVGRFTTPGSYESLRRSAAPMRGDPRLMSAALVNQLEVADVARALGTGGPFLLPDPDRDPAAFALARSRWKQLEAEGNRFLKRPRVAALYREQEARFLAGYEAAKEALDDALRWGLSAGECKKRFERLCAFESWLDVSELRSADAQHRATDDPAEFRPPPAPKADLSMSTEYRPWLTLLAAESAGQPVDPLEIPGRVGLLYSQWRERVLGNAFTPEKKYQVRISSRAEASTREAGAEAVFLGLLRKIAGLPVPNGAPELSTSVEPDANATLPGIPLPNVPAAGIADFVAAWGRMRDGVQRPQPSDEGQHRSADALSQLIEIPGSAILFELREAAGHDALDHLLPDPGAMNDWNSALGIKIRDRLEQAISAEKFDVATRIVALSELTRSLPQEVSRSYDEAVRELGERKATDRGSYLAILARTESPAVAAVALRRLGVER